MPVSENEIFVLVDAEWNVTDISHQTHSMVHSAIYSNNMVYLFTSFIGLHSEKKFEVRCERRKFKKCTTQIAECGSSSS